MLLSPADVKTAYDDKISFNMLNDFFFRSVFNERASAAHERSGLFEMTKQVLATDQRRSFSSFNPYLRIMSYTFIEEDQPIIRSVGSY